MRTSAYELGCSFPIAIFTSSSSHMMQVFSNRGAPSGNHLMANNESQEPFLSVSVDASHQSNEKNLLKRRRSRYPPNINNAPSLRTENGIEISPPHPDFISARERFSFKRAFMFFSIYLSIGTLCFYLVRHQIKGKKTNGILDAVYFCVVTMTTVGYGDLVPDSTLAKLLACVFVFSGMGLVGFVLSKAADYIVEKEEILLVKAIRNINMCDEAECKKAKYKFLTVLILLLVLVAVGTMFLHQFEGLDLVDAFYCVCATISTLGYGDQSFSTQGGRLFAVFWIVISTLCLAQLFLYLAELYTENRQRVLINWALSRDLTTEDLEAADLDNDKVVSVSEFIVYKLKEMGKITEDDISVVMEGFRNLDVDHSGTLTASDLMISGSPQARN